MKRLLYLSLVAALSACNVPPHSRPGVESGVSPETQAYWDAFRECSYETRAATAEITDSIRARSKQMWLFELCMEARGYDY
jgi:hypothetical protein